MLLSDADLFQAVLSGEIELEPFSFDLIQPASVDVRLDAAFQVFNRETQTHIDPRRPQRLTRLVEVPAGRPFVLQPGDFVLGSTVEHITLPDGLAARVEGKSSLGRLGLIIQTAGWIDPGFSGQITLELSNLSPMPILLWPDMPIGQLSVMQMTSPAAVPYGPGRGSKYQGQRGPTPSRAAA